ncbi:unnamed protein product, partial [Timema podura]|nr:unnamed protein product [Timema podura]
LEKTSCSCQDMEREMNVYWMELVKDLGHGWGSSLLVAQMNKLMSCLDLYLEAAGSTGIAPAEFSRERIFFKPVRGRNRCRPYKFLHVSGGIFTQR